MRIALEMDSCSHLAHFYSLAAQPSPKSSSAIAVKRVLHALEPCPPVAAPYDGHGGRPRPMFTQSGVVVSHSSPRCVEFSCVSEL